jgi:hypothetical protein
VKKSLSFVSYVPPTHRRGSTPLAVSAPIRDHDQDRRIGFADHGIYYQPCGGGHRVIRKPLPRS